MECNKIYWWNLPQSVRELIARIIGEEDLSTQEEDALKNIGLRVQWFNLPSVVRQLKNEVSDILDLGFEDRALIWFKLPREVEALCNEVNS
jgi:hypothetical protein